MTIRIARVAGLAALALVLAAPAQAQSVLLRLDPEQGQVSRYAMDMETHMESPMMSSDQPFMVAQIYTTQTVTAVEGDVITYTMTTDSTHFETPAMPMMQQNMPDMAGETQTMKMDTRGRVVEVNNEDLPPEAQQMLNQMGSGFGMQLPEGEVSPGDTWTARFEMGGPGMPGADVEMLIEVTYTLVSVSSGLATIAFEGPVSISGGQGGQGMDASGTMSGTLVFDVDAGRMNSTETEMQMQMNAGGMNMSMNQSMNMRLIGS